MASSPVPTPPPHLLVVARRLWRVLMPYLGDALRLRRSPYMGAVRRTIPGASRRYKRSTIPLDQSLAASPAAIQQLSPFLSTPRFVFYLKKKNRVRSLVILFYIPTSYECLISGQTTEF